MSEAVSSTPAQPAATSATPEGNAQTEAAPKGAVPTPSGGLSKQLDSSKAPAEGAPASEKPEPPAKKKFKLKVDGQEFEEELSDDDIAIRLQKEKAWNKRQNELASERKKLEELMTRGKKDPFAAMKELFGVDGLELAQQKLAEQYQKELKQSQLTPEERLREEYEAKLAEERGQREKIQKEIEAKETAALEERVFQETQQSFIAALETEGIPKSYEALAEMAQVAKLAHQAGYQLSPAQLATEVRNRIEAREEKLHQSVLTGLTGENLLKRIPEPVVKEIVKAVLARKQAAAPPPSAPVKRAAPAKPAQEEANLSEGQKRLRRLGLI